jgi:hypothetical protein
MRAVVYILAQDPESERTAAVERLFDNELFMVNVVNIAVPKEQKIVRFGPALTTAQTIEAYRVLWCLTDAKKRYPDCPVAVVKDTSVSNVDANTLANIVKVTLQQADWDLCYLCKWHDRCDLYTNKKAIDGRSTVIAKSQSPHGVQAILFSLKGRDAILRVRPMKNETSFPEVLNRPIGVIFNDAIVSGLLDAIAVVPNLIEFDVNAAKNNADFMKLSECRTVPTVGAPPAGAPPAGPRYGSGPDNITSTMLVNGIVTGGKNLAAELTVVNDSYSWVFWILIILAIIVVIAIGWSLYRLNYRQSTSVEDAVVAVGAVNAANAAGMVTSESTGMSIFG